MTTFRLLFIALSLPLFSMHAFAMDSTYSNFQRQQLEEIQRNIANLQNALSAFGLGGNAFRTSPSGTPFSQPSSASCSNTTNGKKKLKHSEFITLPVELHGKDLVHVKCDCDDLVQVGHYCGSHALTHAIDNAQIFKMYPTDQEPSKVVMSAFDKLEFHDKKDRTNAINIMRAAELLGLEATFLTEDKGIIVANFYSTSELPVVRAMKDLDALRKQFQTSGDKPFVRPIFFCFDEHVALFSLTWDGETFSIVLTDNLNKPLQQNTPLFRAARFLANYFAFNGFTVMKDLVAIFAPKDDQARYQFKFDQYAQNLNKLKGENQAYDLLKHLFENWRNRVLEAMVPAELNLATINAPLKLLKRLFNLAHSPRVKVLIIETYVAMLDAIERSTVSSDVKKSQLEKVIVALKKSAEEKYFSFKEDVFAWDAFERAQSLRNSLNSY